MGSDHFPTITTVNACNASPKTQVIKMNNENINLTTLNCKNIRANYVYINELFKEYAIIFIQEHWLKSYEIPETGDY